MSGKKTSPQNRSGFATQRRSQIIIAVIVVLSLPAAWSMLASSGALDPAFRHLDQKDQPVSIASFNSNSPSKEYIYAGGRLVATEEPASLDTIGLYSATDSRFFLRNSNSTGAADLDFNYGPAGAGWTPLVGDWNADGTDTVGLFNPATSTFFLKNTNAAGAADLVFAYGPAGAGWTPLVGDWDGDGTDTVGLFDPATHTFFLKNTNAAGAGDLVFGYGPGGAGWKPIAGDWDGM